MGDSDKTARAMKAQGTEIKLQIRNVRVEHLTNPKKSKESFEIINAVLELTDLFSPGLETSLKLLTGLDDVDAAVKKCFEESESGDSDAEERGQGIQDLYP